MQDMVDCDNDRTPEKIQGSDIYRFVGDIQRFQSSEIVMLYLKYHTILLDRWDSTCSAANMRLV